MIRNTLRRIIKVGMVILGAAGLPVSAAGLGDAAKELQKSGAAPYGVKPEGTILLPQLIGGIITIFLEIVGSLFLLLMIYGGYEWMTARGDAEKVKKAKELIVNAIIGIVIVMGAYIITNFVVHNLVPA